MTFVLERLIYYYNFPQILLLSYRKLGDWADASLPKPQYLHILHTHFFSQVIIVKNVSIRHKSRQVYCTQIQIYRTYLRKMPPKKTSLYSLLQGDPTLTAALCSVVGCVEVCVS